MAMMRRGLAFPFYLAAFILHLLTAALTVFAQKVAGDDFETSRLANIIGATLICCAASVALTLWGYRALNVPAQPTVLTLQTPHLHWREVPTGFLPEQIVWAKPLIRLTACLFAQRAVRFQLEPQIVGFDPCGESGKNDIKMDDDYFEASVSGTAKVNGAPQPFKVDLNHYPPSTSEWGFIVTGIQVGKAGEATPTAACAN